jgi:hypothetical protein
VFVTYNDMLLPCNFLDLVGMTTYHVAKISILLKVIKDDDCPTTNSDVNQQEAHDIGTESELSLQQCLTSLSVLSEKIFLMASRVLMASLSCYTMPDLDIQDLCATKV